LPSKARSTNKKYAAAFPAETPPKSPLIWFSQKKTFKNKKYERKTEMAADTNKI